MKASSLSIFLVLLLSAAGCSTHRAPQYNPEKQCLLIGKSEYIGFVSATPEYSKIFGNDTPDAARFGIYKIFPNGEKRFIGKLHGEYTVLALDPGIYGIDKARFEFKSGVFYQEQREPVVGAVNYAPLFEENFWSLPEEEQARKLGDLAPDLFGILKLNAGDAAYCGDLTYEIVTGLFQVSRDTLQAKQFLASTYPDQAPIMENKDWTGPSFFLGRHREALLMMLMKKRIESISSPVQPENRPAGLPASIHPPAGLLKNLLIRPKI